MNDLPGRVVGFIGEQARQLQPISPFGLRTAAATVFPLIVGQTLGFPAVGLMIGLGGLYVSLADKEGATVRTLLAATVIVALAALCATLAGSHPQIAVFSMFIVAFLSGLAAAFGVLPGHLGFVASITYGAMLGIPGDAAAGKQRMLCIFLGGLWATLLTVLLWHYERQRTTGNAVAVPQHTTRKHRALRESGRIVLRWRERQLRRSLRPDSMVLQHALRLGFIAGLAVTLQKLFSLPHGSWLTITVLVIVKPDYTSTQQRAVERVIGTLLGGILALLTASLVNHVVFADLALLALSSLAYSNQKHNYALFVLFLTPFIVLLLTIASPGTERLAPTRVLDTLIGGALALALAYLFRARQVGAT